MSITKKTSLLFLISVALYLLLSTLLPFIAGDSADLTYLFNSLFVSIPAFLIPAIVFRRINRFPVFKAPRFPHIMLAAAIGVGCLQLNQALSCLMSAAFYDLELNSLSTTSETVSELNGFNMLLSLAIVPPVTEEFIMRGTVLEGYRRSSPAAAMVISSLMFALLHAAPSAIPVYFAIGMVLALVYLITRSVWMTITVHFVNNLASVLGALLIKLMSGLEDAGEAAAVGGVGLLDTRAGLFGLAFFYGLVAAAILVPLFFALRATFRRAKLGMYAEEAPTEPVGAEPELCPEPEPNAERAPLLADPFLWITLVILVGLNVYSALFELGVIAR